mmetsp:Transcript_5279/g.13312  ORF Transcript_5279/g.13312 Transcript_5279/m.13312 type:complete len:163 (+) Transcript_5279:441-929(+)
MAGLETLVAWIGSADSSNSDKTVAIKKAAVTNAPRANAEAILSGLGLDRWFGEEYLIIGAECDKPKPDPCPYLTACERLGVQLGDCIVFEDSPSGAFVVGILSSQDEATLRSAGCHAVISDFDDARLWKLLNQHQEQQQQPNKASASTPKTASQSSSIAQQQ